ncbi:MAG: DUF2769 domain-containing protein [Candidatus Ranarchaeia archaeon]|jgi:hypothetical protein
MADESYYKATTFEEKFKLLATGEWTPKLRKESAEQVAYMCQCAKCPTYQGTGETILVFCTLGKSDHIQQEKECLCPQCGVTKTMSMRWTHYCTQGSAYDRSNFTQQ